MYHNFLDIIYDENDNLFDKDIENNNDDNEVINKTDSEDDENLENI